MMSDLKDKVLEQSARKNLRLCREDVEQGRWSDVIARTQDPALFLRLPQIMLYRLQGALLTNHDQIVNEIAGHASSLKGKEVFAYAIIRDLVACRRSDIAGRILLDNEFLHAHPRFLKAAEAIVRSTTNEDLQAGLKNLANDVSHGGSQLKPAPTEFRFALQPPIKDLGSLKVLGSSATSSHHVVALRREARLFRTEISKQLQPEIMEFRNVFSSSIGQVWNEDGQIIRSRKAPIPFIERSKATQIAIALSSNRPSTGIYHWLVDHLPRFAFLGGTGLLADETFKILLNGSNPEFEQVSLDMIDLGGSTYRVEQPVFVERLLIPRMRFEGMVGWRHLDSVFAVMVERATQIARAHGIVLPDRVYITRRDAKRRPLINEAEVEKEMQMYGFEVAEFSTLPLWHQIAIARNASMVASPHGAGLAHIIFARPHTRIIEILPIKDGTYKLRFNYARLSLAKQHDYAAWMEPQQPKLDAWTVDVPAFRKFLARMMKAA